MVVGARECEEVVGDAIDESGDVGVNIDTCLREVYNLALCAAAYRAGHVGFG